MTTLTEGLSIDVTQLPQNVNMDDDFELDSLYIYCRDRSILHPDWGTLAGRVQMYGIKRHAPRSFSESVREQQKRNLLDADYYDFVMRNASQLDAMVNHDADWKFNDFAMATLLHSYLFKVSVKTDRRDANGNVEWTKWYLETPQYMYMRVAVFVKYSNSACQSVMSSIKKMYQEQSEGLYTHASPTLFNAGRKRHQLSSCFLQSTSDTMESIEAGWIASAEISRNSGGIGISYSSLRHSEIAQQGVSGGIVRWVKILTDILNAVDQGGLRKGSGAVYIEPWHIDVDAFLDLRKSAVAEDLRARDIYTALWIPDLFMKRVSEDGYWTLLCPNIALKDGGVDLTKVWGREFEQAYERCEELELRSSKRIRARDLWQRILSAQIETGTPYMTFKDACNRKSNQQNLGTIKCSNLCVSGDTLVLTDEGHIRIDTLKDQTINVWNGEEFSETTVIQTGADKELVEVVCSNGTSLRCTPYHKFYIQKEYYGKPETVEAGKLEPGSNLMKCHFPVIEGGDEEFKYPYTHGAFCGDGTYFNVLKTTRVCSFRATVGFAYCQRHIQYQVESETSKMCKAVVGVGQPRLSLYGEKKELVKWLDVRTDCSEPLEDSEGRLNCFLPVDIRPKFDVPLNSDLHTRLEWLAGYADTDGSIARNGTNQQLQISSINREFLGRVSLMLQTMGCDPKISLFRKEGDYLLPNHKGGNSMYHCNKVYRLLVTSYDLYNLVSLGFNPHRLKIIHLKPQRNARQFVKVVSVTPVSGLHDTYCFNEPKRHMGVFNGILTGQCSEIVQYSSDDEIASCNLASIALNACVLESKLRGGKYFSLPLLIKATSSLVRNLNNVIDRNYYPDRVPTIRYANFRNRPMGIGIQGLADVFALLDLTWDSAEARQLNRDIAEAMYYGAVRESVELAKEFGRYETFQDSPASKGFFQFDLWDLEDEEKRTGLPVDKDTFLSRKDVVRTKLNPDYNWEALRSDMIEFGMRNSLLIANMPTASSASILSNNEAFEPFTQTNYARTTLSGQFVITNKHMVADLEEIDWWNTKVVVSMLNTQGSIQHIPLPSEGMTEDEINNLSVEEKEVLVLRDARVVFLKKKYLNVFELSQRLLTDYNLDRSRFVCQSQSFNCWMKEPTATKLSAFHFYNWEHGAKTGMYYLRQSAKIDPINFTIDSFNVPVSKHVIDVEALKKRNDGCVSCSS